MQLIPIGFQREPEALKTFSSYHHYYQCNNSKVRQKDAGMIGSMLELIEHLENNVDAPPQWVCTSHYDLMVYGKDFENYSGKVSDYYHLRIEVRENATELFHITQILPSDPNRDSRWSSSLSPTFTTNDVVTAGRIIADILNSKLPLP